MKTNVVVSILLNLLLCTMNVFADVAPEPVVSESNIFTVVLPIVVGVVAVFVAFKIWKRRKK